MAFQTGTATGPGDLLVQLWDFLATNGWTIDVDWSSASQSPQFGVIHRRLSPESELNLTWALAADADTIRIFPLRDYTSGDPADNLSGAFFASSYTSNTGLTVNAIPGPFENYWFFEGDYYIHVVIEYTSGFFRHFGCGQLNKIGSWSGGEYYYGHYWEQNVSQIDSPNSQSHFPPHESLTSGSSSRATVMYGTLIDGSPFPNIAGRQSPESVWHAMGIDNGTGAGTDRDGRDRGALSANSIRRSALWPIMGIGQSQFNGYRPLLPITYFASANQPNPDYEHVIGTVPDTRNLSLINLGVKEIVTVGSDQWYTFPLTRKLVPETSDNTEQSLSFGIAYRRNNT